MRNIACVAIDFASYFISVYFISRLFHFKDHGLQLIGHGRESALLHQHFSVGAAPDYDVVLAPFGVLGGEVLAKLRAAALLAEQRSTGHGLRHHQEAGEVHGGVPSVVVLTVARDTRADGPRLQLRDHLQCLLHLVLGSHDAHQVLHLFLQIVLNLVGILSGKAELEGDEGGGGCSLKLLLVNGCRHTVAPRKLRGVPSGASSEDDEIGERIAAQPVCAVQSGRYFSRREEPGYGRHLRIPVYADSSHHVVGCRSDFHWLFSDVQIGELLELVIHAGQLALDVLLGFGEVLLDPGNVQKDAAVGGAASCLDLAIDAAGDVVAGEEFGRAAGIPVSLRVAPALLFRLRGLALVEIGDLVEHEAAAFAVAQDAAFAAHPLGHQDAAHADRPDHAG